MVQEYTNWPMERLENSEADPSIYRNLIYDRTDILDLWGKGWIDFSIYGAWARACTYERK